MKGLNLLLCKIGFLSLLISPAVITHAKTTDNKLVIGGYRLPFDTPPYQWQSPCTGQVDGSLPHLVIKYLGDLGVDASYYDYAKESDEVTFDFIPIQLSAGTYGATISFSKNMGDGKIKTTQRPIISTEQAAIFFQDRVTINSFDDLKKLRGVINLGKIDPQMNPTYNFAIQNDLNFITSESKKESFQLLTDNQADYMIADYYRTLLLAKDKQLRDKLSLFRLQEKQRGFYLAVKKGGKWDALVDQLDEYMAKNMNDKAEDVVNRAYLSKWLKRSDCSVK